MSMKLRIGILLGLLLGVAGAVAASELKVIVHPDVSVSSVSRAELSKLFFKRLRSWSDGSSVVPVDQTPDRPVRARFDRVVHGRSVVTVEIFWKRMIFSGRAVPPPELESDEAVVEFVRTTPGAVGYVDGATPLEGVRILTVSE